MNDEDDDSMAANPEPHVTTGYTSRKRREEHGEWVMRFEPRPPTRPEPKPHVKNCKQCKAEVAILHAIGPRIEREYCGKCQGDANRARMEGRYWP